MFKRGNAVVEFALVFPFFVFLCVAAFRVGLLAIQQFGWHRLCAQTARTLALSSLATAPELTAEARRILSNHEPLGVQIRVQPVPSRTPVSAYRNRKRVELIDLTLEKEVSLFRLRAKARQTRIRTLGRV